VKPSSPPARPQAHHLRVWAVSARAAPRFPVLGRAQLAQLVRAAAVPFTASLTPWLHLSGPPSSFPRRRPISFHRFIESNSSPNPFPSLSSASPDYIFRARAPLRSILPRSSEPKPSRGGSARTTVGTVRHPEHRTVFGPTPPLYSTLVSSPCSLLHSGALISRGNAVNREIALSGDGAAVGLAVGTVFRLENRRRPIRSNPSR
jgi:hypothetical protein